jgi:hypothetical protein
MNLDSLSDYLDDQGTVTTEGITGLPRLFIYESPSESRENEDTFALLINNLAGFYVNEETPDYHKGAIQLITSSKKYDEGYELALSLSKELHVLGLELRDMYIFKCIPTTLPISYRRNEQQLFEFSVNFNVVLRLIR